MAFAGRKVTTLLVSPNVLHALERLREDGVEVRTRRTNGLLVWKPSPKEMHPMLLTLVRTHKFGLQRALAALINPWPVHRSGWTYGGVQGCEFCGQGCVMVDPLGHARHSWCGWLGQVPVIEPIVQVPCYPAHLSGGAA